MDNIFKVQSSNALIKQAIIFNKSAINMFTEVYRRCYEDG